MADNDPRAVLAALARYPPLPAADGRVAAVGGFVRDVWLGREPRELDVVIEGDAVAFARALGGELVVHEPFGTASASGPGWRVDVAAARSERYPAPGVLPLVERSSLEEDLPRRDFTANAIAVTVEGQVIASPRARCACSTTRASPTTRRGSSASSVSQRAWSSRSSRTRPPSPGAPVSR